MASHKFLVLDTSTPGLFECWRKLKYTRERFGLGSFSLVVPVDHAQAGVLAKQKRILIVRDDGSTQVARFWGIITGLRKFYAANAGPALGGSGTGQTFVAVRGVTFLEYFLSGRVYSPNAPVILSPDGNGDFTAWTGAYTDVDDSPDSHDSDTTYATTAASYARESYTLAKSNVGLSPVAAIKLRSVWRREVAGSDAAYMTLKIPGYNQVTRVPTANGGCTDWSGNVPFYQQVDDPVGSSDDDSTYIEGNVLNGRASFSKAVVGLDSPGQVVKVSVVLRARKEGGATGKLKAFVRIGGVNYDGSGELTLTTSYANLTETWTVNPATAQPWALSEVNGLEIGVLTSEASDYGYPYNIRCTQIYLVVDYVYQYTVGMVSGTSYAELSRILELNPATGVAWTEADLDDLEVGLYVGALTGTLRVTSVAVEVFHDTIVTTDHLDDVFKDWVAACLVSGVASADRAVSGFAVEADEHAGASDSYVISYNLLLERMMALAKLKGVGMEVVGNWGSGATKLNAAASYTFNTCVPEGVDRTHDQAVVADVIISRERGIVRVLDYEQDATPERNAVTALGPAVSGCRDQETVTTSPTPTGLSRREGVLDVPAGDTAAILTDVATKFLNDEGLARETVRFEYASLAPYTPLSDFVPGDLVSFYDLVLGIGPLQPTVEEITCEVGSDGVERYEVGLGKVPHPASAEDAAYRAVGKRETLYTL